MDSWDCGGGAMDSWPVVTNTDAAWRTALPLTLTHLFHIPTRACCRETFSQDGTT